MSDLPTVNQGQASLLDSLLQKTSMPSVTAPTIEKPANNDLFAGLDIEGIGTLASVLGGIFSAKEDRKYKKELMEREDARIARARKRQDAFESDMKSSWN